MQRQWWVWTVGATGVGLLVALLWPPPDPLGRVRTVAVRPPQWERADPAHQAPFMDGLTLTLRGRDVRLVAELEEADAVLVVNEVRVASAQLDLASGRLHARLEAACHLTELATGKKWTMDLRLELRDGEVQASLTARRFWEFWKKG